MKLSNKYHKIPSVYKRADDHSFLVGDWSIPELAYLKDNDWVWTEKVDGTNIRVIWDGERVKFGGRSDEAQINTNLLLKLQELFIYDDAIKWLKDIFVSFGEKENFEVVFYGEGYGANIQKGGGNYSKDPSFVLFDIMVDGMFLERHNVIDVANKLGLPEVVPVIGHGTLLEAIEYVKKGFLSTWGDFTAEGLVLRPRVELLTRKGERIITKVKVKDFK